MSTRIDAGSFIGFNYWKTAGDGALRVVKVDEDFDSSKNTRIMGLDLEDGDQLKSYSIDKIENLVFLKENREKVPSWITEGSINEDNLPKDTQSWFFDDATNEVVRYTPVGKPIDLKAPQAGIVSDETAPGVTLFNNGTKVTLRVVRRKGQKGLCLDMNGKVYQNPITFVKDLAGILSIK